MTHLKCTINCLLTCQQTTNDDIYIWIKVSFSSIMNIFTINSKCVMSCHLSLCKLCPLCPKHVLYAGMFPCVFLKWWIQFLSSVQSCYIRTLHFITHIDSFKKLLQLPHAVWFHNQLFENSDNKCVFWRKAKLTSLWLRASTTWPRANREVLMAPLSFNLSNKNTMKLKETPI